MRSRSSRAFSVGRCLVSEGVKYDGGKRRFSLLPWAQVSAIVDVLEFGARKYEVDNWQRVPNATERYANAAMRHHDHDDDHQHRDAS